MHISVIYVLVSFIREKIKKRVFLGQFAMCQGRASPRAAAMAHGEARLFAVWHRPKQTVEPRGRRAPMPVLPCAAPVDTQ